MTAGFHDFSCTRGEPFSASITLVNPDNEYASLQYWGSRMQVRRSISADSVVVELSTSNSRITHDLENSKIELSLSSDDTVGLDTGDHVYDLELFSIGSKLAVVKVIRGLFSVG
jgi:hypothetical protein